MLPDPRFINLPKHFWANIRTISQHIGYTARGTGQVLVPALPRIRDAMAVLGLAESHLMKDGTRPTKFGELVLAYYQHRASVLNTFVEPRLLDAAKAKAMFEDHQRRFPTKRTAPMNKQKAEKRAPAYLTACVNMLIESHAEGYPCDYDPRELTTVTVGGAPLRTLARRVDGAFPGPINPIAVWEIKEYYYTTTFGSRVADGVYETLLDGMELEELRKEENIDVKHYLMIDAHYTWWKCGRSYLCRIVDMLHMGYVDEVLFGREVAERLPTIVKEWITLAKKREAGAAT
jgi:hypothetical protein